MEGETMLITAASSLPLEGEVMPYYQPIVSLQTRKITGYESLGRMQKGDRVVSLGPFFADASAGVDKHLEVDRLLRSAALRRLSVDTTQTKLFINLKPSWIYNQYQRSGTLPTLQLIEQLRVDPKRVVIEITEEEFQGDLEELTKVIAVYREAGCTIAIDDIGAGCSNYDRIASIRPHLLKIDMKLLNRSSTHKGYQALLNSFAILSGQIGASLLAEGIETKQDLRQALRAGARYVQGYLFSPAQQDFLPEDAFEPLLLEEIGAYTAEEQTKYETLFSVQDRLNALVLMETHFVFRDADSLIEQLLPAAPANVVRMYVCQEDGCQVSANYSLSDGGQWDKDEQYRGSNWIWRPYFIPNIVRMNQGQKSMLSAVYTDLDSSQLMQTYSCPVGERCYLFLDIRV